MAERVLLPRLRDVRYARTCCTGQADLPKLSTSEQFDGQNNLGLDPHLAEGLVRCGVVHHQPVLTPTSDSKSHRRRAGCVLLLEHSLGLQSDHCFLAAAISWRKLEFDRRAARASRPCLQYQIEGRFGGAAKPFETALRHHLPQALLAGLRSEARTDFLGTRCRRAYEC